MHTHTPIIIIIIITLKIIITIGLTFIQHLNQLGAVFTHCSGGKIKPKVPKSNHLQLLMDPKCCGRCAVVGILGVKKK